MTLTSVQIFNMLTLFKKLVARFSPQKAEGMVRGMLKWRAKNNVDDWNNDPELFAEFEQDYPIYVDGNDKTGRPSKILTLSQRLQNLKFNVTDNRMHLFIQS